MILIWTAVLLQRAPSEGELQVPQRTHWGPLNVAARGKENVHLNEPFNFIIPLKIPLLSKRLRNPKNGVA